MCFRMSGIGRRLRVYVCHHHGVVTSACSVVVAGDEEEAKELLYARIDADERLREEPRRDGVRETLTFEEISLSDPRAIILHTGDV